jgi:hypothetical protein
MPAIKRFAGMARSYKFQSTPEIIRKYQEWLFEAKNLLASTRKSATIRAISLIPAQSAVPEGSKP